MQGEVHSIALSACPAVLEGPLRIRPVSSVHLCIAGSPPLSTLSRSGKFLAKAQRTGEDLGEGVVTSFGGKTKMTTSHPVAEVASVAAADTAVSDILNPDSALAIAHPVNELDLFKSPMSGVPSDGQVSDATTAMLVVVGHRGCGKNKSLLQSGTPEASMSTIRENTITSFNMAARNGAQFVEFDVQVTSDGVPIIFHDDVIITDAAAPGKHIGDITLEEFRAMGPQRDSAKVGQALYRCAADGTRYLWTADVEDAMCTLAEAFREIEPTVGFNIELKFDDDGSTSEPELHRVIDAVLADVGRYANGRMLYFSSFHPDAVQILRRQLPVYPVFFLTNGGLFMYPDERRNSIEAAIEVCKKGNLQGIVSEVQAVLQCPAAVALVKAEGLFFFTYGELNNVGEAIRKQQGWGIDGVIVDHVLEMVRVARHLYDTDSRATAALARRRVSVV